MPSSKPPKSITPIVQFMVICSQIDHDASGAISLTNLFDSVHVPEDALPGAIQLSVSTQVRGGQGTHRFWIRIESPDGTTSETREDQFWLASSASSHRFDIRVTLGIKQFGKHSFTAVLNGRDVMTLPLTVEKA